MGAAREQLAAEIEERFGTVHRFCKLHEAHLNRSTVYMVLGGVYAGNTEVQLKRIRAVMEHGGQKEQIFQAIKRKACERCSVTTRPCNRCDKLFTAQACAVLEVV